MTTSTRLKCLTILQFCIRCGFEEDDMCLQRMRVTWVSCSHSICAMNAKGDDPYAYVHDYYKVETYKRVYNYTIIPTNGRFEWPKSNLKAIEAVAGGKIVGRLGGARRLEADEVPSKKKKTCGKTAFSKSNPKRMKRQQDSVTCSYCKIEGNSKKGCEKRKEAKRACIAYVPESQVQGEVELESQVEIDSQLRLKAEAEIERQMNMENQAVENQVGDNQVEIDMQMNVENESEENSKNE